MSEIKRRKSESFDSFLRRVKQRWIKSGKLLQARKVQYFVEEKSKNVQRKSAITRAKTSSKLEYLRKIGKMPEEEEHSYNHGTRR